MSEMKSNETPMYAVMLTDGQDIKTVEALPNEEMFDFGRRHIGCEWIELVEPEALESQGLVLMIDEEAKLKSGEKYVNCIASYAYNSQEHGDMIVGNAVIVKAGEEDLKLMTKDEAHAIAVQMARIRGEAIYTIGNAIQPKTSVLDSLHKTNSGQDRRQPCSDNRTER